MEEQTKELKDFLDAFRRRRVQIIAVSSMLFVVSLLVTFLWPSTYRSMATILIEEQEIPPDLIRSTITSYATQRIQTISQTVMTRSNLMQIIEKYDLYPRERKRDTTEEVIDGMRKDIKLEMINADVIDPRTGRPTPATIAFTLAFDSQNPGTAQKVANELTSLYLNENLKTRTEKATETVDFLVTEAHKISEHIADVESKLAAFKQKNPYNLPELSGLNLQLMDKTERDLAEVDNQMRSLQDRKFYLDGQLAQINPLMPMYSEDGDKVPDPETKLKMLRAEYITASSKYSPDHPDVIRLRREIDGLEKQLGNVDSANEQAKQLATLRSQLAAAREKYSADHPDVIRLSKEVATMEAAIKQLPDRPETTVAKEKPENPAYITLKAQADSIKSEMESLLATRDQLKAKMADYERRIAKTPEVEREYLTLKRDYENSVKSYQELKAKQMDAEVGKELEKERKGERFSLIDPPQFPEQPIKPNRPAIFILGILLSLASGLGYAVVAESVDKSVYGARGISSLFGTPPLSVIPYMPNKEDVMRAEHARKIAVIAITGTLVLVILLIHFLWTPLDVLWFKGLRKVDTVIGS